MGVVTFSCNSLVDCNVIVDDSLLRVVVVLLIIIQELGNKCVNGII